MQPFPQVRELFQRIRADGKPIVLATSGKESEAKHYTKLLGIEDLIVGQTTADTPARSQARARHLQRRLGATRRHPRRAEALVVGDTRFDLEAAGRGGFPAIAVLCGGTDEITLREAGAPLDIYRDPADLLASYDDLEPER